MMEFQSQTPRKHARSQFTSWEHIKDHMTADVSPSLFAEVQLLILTFCTGIQGKQSMSSG
jgi:hypothetical protein